MIIRCLLIGMSLLTLLSVASAQDASDRVSDRLDTSRAKTEERYNKLGNEEQTEKVVRPPQVITVPAETGRKKTARFLVEERVRPKTKRIVIPGSVVTVTKPAATKVNPY